MRLTRYHLFLLGGLLVMVLGPLAFTQPGPGGKGERKGPPPDMMFVMMSGGNETFEVSKVQLRQWPGGPTVEQQREQMLGYLQKKGIKDGVMTKAVFPDYWEERMVEMRAMKEAKQRQTADLGAISLVAPPAPAQDLDAQGRDAFASLDTDKNGVLSIEEMQAAAKRGSRIYDERDRWDTNKNGTIELDEYLAYFRNRNSPSC